MRGADVLAERADRGVLDGAAEVCAGVQLAVFGTAGAEHRPHAFEVVGEGHVLELRQAEGGDEFERMARAEGRDGARPRAIDAQAAARDRGAAARSPALAFPGGARPAGREAGPGGELLT